MDARKYCRTHGPKIASPKWVQAEITQAPAWCSVCLRDGNQALAIPMTLERKLMLFRELVRIGVKEIEVGYPAANQTEFAFVRHLIENNLVPDGVTIQVLTMAREDLILRTFEALSGVQRATVHFYVGTSSIFQEQVLRVTKEAGITLATQGAAIIAARVRAMPWSDIGVEFSPEHFSNTDAEYAVEVCDAVTEVLRDGGIKRIIINLPATVEICSPKAYANMVEWFCAHMRHRSHVSVSVHVHNDRGTGVAATEMALMAGADRVEGTIFGNGERTGNVDLVTVALNLYSDGVDPGLDLSDIRATAKVYEDATGMSVPLRHPYAGELVFTAFSGSHQDAISKVLEHGQPGTVWQVPYLGVDPEDIGRTLEVVRINAQSGKGGVEYVLRADHHIRLPAAQLAEFSQIVTHVADSETREITSERLHQLLREVYVAEAPMVDFRDLTNTEHPRTAKRQVFAQVCLEDGTSLPIAGTGNGFLSAFHDGLRKLIEEPYDICDEQQRSRGDSADAVSFASVAIRTRNTTTWGVAEHTSATTSIVFAYLSAVNRALAQNELNWR